MKTITLENLLQTFPLPCNDRVFNRDRIRNLLPEDISNELLLVEGKDCSSAQLSNVWRSNATAQPKIFIKVFNYLNGSAFFKTYCDKIFEKWQTVENLDARESRSKLEKIFNDDEDKQEMSPGLWQWFRTIFALQDPDLLRWVLD